MNPELWLEDYWLASQADGADNDDFIIRNLPLFLANSAQTWLEHQPSREDPRRLTFSYSNDMVQLAGGEPLSPKHQQLARQVVRIMTISLSVTFHCSWPIRHEHGWNTCHPIESKVGWS